MLRVSQDSLQCQNGDFLFDGCKKVQQMKENQGNYEVPPGEAQSSLGCCPENERKQL